MCRAARPPTIAPEPWPCGRCSRLEVPAPGVRLRRGLHAVSVLRCPGPGLVRRSDPALGTESAGRWSTRNAWIRGGGACGRGRLRTRLPGTVPGVRENPVPSQTRETQEALQAEIQMR